MLVYDLEIVKAIQSRGEPREPDIDYCEGFDDKANMGISVLGVYDYVEDRYRTFCEDNWADFVDLQRQRDCLVSWNGLGFDNPVIQEAWGLSIPEARCYDLMAECKRACGHPPDAPRRGFRLGQWAAANLGAGKTGDGAMAPVDWQRGRYGSVIDYCLADVWLTKRLFDRVLACGILTEPNTKDPAVSLRPPWSVVSTD